jgi:hypothetical protein
MLTRLHSFCILLGMEALTTMIETASASLGERWGETANGVPLYRDTASVNRETKIGRVECYVITTDKHTSRHRHVRVTFYLNGQRISRSRLEGLLSA